MRIPLTWLNDYFTAPLTDAEAIARALTNAGLEVEGIERLAPGFERVMTGRIVAADPHPNADRLRVCQTDLGSGEHLQIVTGAANVQVGDIVPVALEGAKLPNGLEIKVSKLRGVESRGMYCSLKELGMEGGVDGVQVLPADTPLGINAADALGVGDVVLSVAVLANRPDALSVLGVARELAAAGLGTIQLPGGSLALSGDSGLSIALEAPDLCPRYIGLVVEGLQVAESPDWLKRRLELAGVRPISNVVDATNFVMLELGQPMHAFDRARLAGTIRARRAQAHERIVTLDGQERTLTPDMLVIGDDQGVQAIAGVMGGLASEVKHDTATVLLEAAYFDPRSVRRTAKVLGLGSESSYRFERGVDPEGTLAAMSRAAGLLLELAGGRVVGPVVDAREPKGFPEPLDVTLRPARVAKVLGAELDLATARQKLQAIGFGIEESGDRWTVRIPGWRRHDVTREVDMIEEIARLLGYDQVPATVMPLNDVGRVGGRAELVSRLRAILEGAGLSEVITPSLVDPAVAADARVSEEGALGLVNPLSDMASLRTSLLPGLLQVARYNHYQGQSDLAVYEVGRTYRHEANDQVTEAEWAAFLVMGAQATGTWKRAPESLVADFFWAKGLVERVAEALALGEVVCEAEVGDPSLHPGRSARMTASGRFIGLIGEVHPAIYSHYDLPQGGRAAVAWLSIDALLELTRPVRSFEAFGRLPAVHRDLALVVSERVPAAEVVATVRAMGGELLEEVTVFDRYQGPQIPEGRVSLGLGLRYRAADRTLSDEDIEPLHRSIVEKAHEAFGAALRDR